MVPDEISSHHTHPWNHLNKRPFWKSPKPQKRERYWFWQRSRSPKTPIHRSLEETQFSTASERVRNVAPEHRHHHDPGAEPNSCYELPGRTPYSPVELVTTEYATYEEAKNEFRAAARRVAFQKRKELTIDQLERVQLEEPGIVKLRRSLSDSLAELDTDPGRPAELAGSSVEAKSMPSAAPKFLSLQPLAMAGGDKSSNLCASLSKQDTALDVQHEGLWQSDEKPVVDGTLEICPEASNQRVSVPSMPLAAAISLAGSRAPLPTTDDTVSGDSNDRCNSNVQELQPGDNRNQISTPLLTSTDGLEIPSPISASLTTSLFYQAASSAGASTADTDENYKRDSYFNELDNMVKVLPPRTSHRRIQRDASKLRSAGLH